MRRVLATELGQRLYRTRSQTVEPMFAHTKHNRGMSRFHPPGRSAARTEWRLITANHNLTKLHSHTPAAATALNRGPQRPPASNRPARRRSRPHRQVSATASTSSERLGRLGAGNRNRTGSGHE
jgi:DDE family transposase